MMNVCKIGARGERAQSLTGEATTTTAADRAGKNLIVGPPLPQPLLHTTPRYQRSFRVRDNLYRARPVPSAYPPNGCRASLLADCVAFSQSPANRGRRESVNACPHHHRRHARRPRVSGFQQPRTKERGGGFGGGGGRPRRAERGKASARSGLSAWIAGRKRRTRRGDAERKEHNT